MCKALTYDVTVKRSRAREKDPSRSFRASAIGPPRRLVHAYLFLLAIFSVATFILSIAGAIIATMAQLERRSNDAKLATQMEKISEYFAWCILCDMCASVCVTMESVPKIRINFKNKIIIGMLIILEAICNIRCHNELSVFDLYLHRVILFFVQCIFHRKTFDQEETESCDFYVSLRFSSENLYLKYMKVVFFCKYFYQFFYYISYGFNWYEPMTCYFLESLCSFRISRNEYLYRERSICTFSIQK